MRVAELVEKQHFEIADRELPEPGPGEVQVRIEAVGVCGSDLHSYSEGGVGDTPCRFPMVLGHEPAGVVVKTGAGVTGWAMGDRAALEPAIYCYHCEFCRSGHHNVCEHLRFMSQPGDPGFFRERTNVPAGNLIAIPPSLSAQEATIVEPLAVVLHSLKFIQPAVGETAAVFGAGPIGLMTVICLKTAGVSRVWCVEPVAHRRTMALSAGADAAIDPLAVDAAAEILRATGNRGVDVAIDCATKTGTINQCIQAARSAGRVVITGIPTETHVAFEMSPMRRKELAVFNVRRSNHDSGAALDLLLAQRAKFAAMITHERPMEEIGATFRQVEKYEGGVGKVIIIP